MPTIDDVEVNFDEMSDDALKAYLDELREVSKSRKPRAGASPRSAKDPSAPKAPRGRKSNPNIIKIEV